MYEDHTSYLEVPRCIHPIVDLNDSIPQESDNVPFFGFAPAETPVRLVNCPDCGRLVSAAHLHLHRKCHESEKQEPSHKDDHFRLQTNRRIAPLVPCSYAERKAYTFRVLIDGDSK